MSRLTPIKQPLAFRAIYCTLLDRDSGPKAGNLLSVLEPEFVNKRFKQLSFSELDFWLDTATTMSEFENWIVKEQGHISDGHTELHLSPRVTSSNEERNVDQSIAPHIFVEFYLTMDDGKKLMI